MKFSKSIDQTTESINNNQSEINRLSNKIASNRQMIKDTTDKIKNISESFLAADHIEKELDERIIQPYYKAIAKLNNSHSNIDQISSSL